MVNNRLNVLKENIILRNGRLAIWRQNDDRTIPCVTFTDKFV